MQTVGRRLIALECLVVLAVGPSCSPSPLAPTPIRPATAATAGQPPPLPSRGVFHGVWGYAQELERQTPAEVCGRHLADLGTSREGELHVHHAFQGDEISLGCSEDDFFDFGICLRGRVDGHGIGARGVEEPHQNPWCESYRLEHRIAWTFEATVESDRAMRGTLTGVFTYVGGGRTTEVERVWRVVLSR